MDREELYSKIKKLLDMAARGTQNEAEIATQKVNEILLKYNLSIQDINNKDAEYVEDDIYKPSSFNYEDKCVGHILVEYFFVRVIHVRKINEIAIRLYGKKENVKIAEYIFIFLRREYIKLWNKYRKTRKKANKHSYMRGLTASITCKLEETKTKVQNETGLILTDDKKLYDYVKDMPNVKERKKPRFKIKDFSNGVEDGKKINIYKPVGKEERESIDRKLYIGNE